MPLNSLNKTVTYIGFIMGRQNADPNKGVAFKYHLVAD